MSNENIKLNIGEKINEFIQRNRKGIFIFLGLFVFMFIGLIVFLSLQDNFRKKAISEVEELNQRFNELRFNIGDGYNSDVETLLAELNVFANNRRGFAGSRAWAIIAQIYSSREEWQKAEDAWLNSARVGARTYLGPIALFNAAVAAEEQGKLEQAIIHLENCIAHPFEFPASPRAQFAIGRLHEQMHNYSAAIEAYRAVLINWQDTPVWPNLARSKIIDIEIR
jgi:tetratricopeptide (TPR) repeat protein